MREDQNPRPLDPHGAAMRTPYQHFVATYPTLLRTIADLVELRTLQKDSTTRKRTMQTQKKAEKLISELRADLENHRAAREMQLQAESLKEPLHAYSEDFRVICKFTLFLVLYYFYGRALMNFPDQ